MPLSFTKITSRTSDGLTAVGTEALVNVNPGSPTATSGIQNVALGWQALKQVVGGASANTGSYNTGVGYDCMASSSASTVSPADCTAVGKGVMRVATTAARNVGVGSEALISLTSGNNNTAVGYQALDGITSGAQNTAVGHSALGAATGASKAHNTAVGFNAGNAVTTGDANTIVGSQADVDSGARTYCVVLGKGAKSPAVNGTLAIGGLAANADNMGNLVVVGAGAPTTNYLNIYLNGTQYKILLYNP